LLGRVKSELPQKSVPRPINISRLIKPTKRLEKDRRTSGKDIANGDSCTCEYVSRNPLAGRRNVIASRRVE
jgi:hypothetical protein